MLIENKINTIREIDTVSRVEKITSLTRVVVLKSYQINTIHFLSVSVSNVQN